MKTLKYSLLFLGVVIGLASCSNNDDSAPEAVNETEVITNVTLTFTDDAGTAKTYTYTNPFYRDDSYTAPNIQLESGKTYQVMANFYDKSDPDNPEVKTNEIIEEKDDHFLEYRFTNVNIGLTRTDGEETTDSNDVQIGLNTQWVAEEAGIGAVQVTLVHQPETKDTSNPNGNHAGGETDAQVSFNTTIK